MSRLETVIERKILKYFHSTRIVFIKSIRNFKLVSSYQESDLKKNKKINVKIISEKRFLFFIFDLKILSHTIPLV